MLSFQICSIVKFNFDSQYLKSSQPLSRGISQKDRSDFNLSAYKLSVCGDGSCVDTGQQKIYFTNLIAVKLKVNLVQDISDQIQCCIWFRIFQIRYNVVLPAN